MKKLIIIFMFFGSWVNAQTNLVPNWSFEDYNSCPTLGTQSCELGTPIIPSLKNWFCALTDNSTPDYYNACGASIVSTPFNFFGYQVPKSGTSYIGTATHCIYGCAINNNSEYIECQLKDSLNFNTTYCVNYYTSRADYRDYASSNFGALFTNTVINIPGLPFYINQIPQVQHSFGVFITNKLNWTKIQGSFVAIGGEKFLTLGSFGPNSNIDTLYDPDIPIDPLKRYAFPYYYVDDVSVEAVTNAQAGIDKSINCGDTVVIGADSAIGADYKWFPKTGLNFDSIAFPLATPTITTKYVLQKKQCSVITYDTVLVTVANNCPIAPTIIHDDEFIIPNVFTPNADGVNDVWLVNLGFGNELKSLVIVNRWGIEVASNSSPSGRLGGAFWDGRTTSGKACSEGVYYYTLEYTNILGEQKKVNGYVSLFR